MQEVSPSPFPGVRHMAGSAWRSLGMSAVSAPWAGGAIASARQLPRPPNVALKHQNVVIFPRERSTRVVALGTTDKMAVPCSETCLGATNCLGVAVAPQCPRLLDPAPPTGPGVGPAGTEEVTEEGSSAQAVEHPKKQGAERSALPCPVPHGPSLVEI